MFRRCRAPDPVGQNFTINGCSAGQVMDIQSAIIGYSDQADLTANPPQCSRSASTTVSIYDIVSGTCNGRCSCNISQELLLRPRDAVWCTPDEDANFIDVRFFCVAGTIRFHFT